MEPDAVVSTAAALIHEEPEVAESFLLAAVYVRAITTDQSPRNIIEALYKALPSSDAWPKLRDALVEAIDEGAGDRS